MSSFLPSRLIGLTGGIATGKSAVSRRFRALGAKVIDADELAREVVFPGTPGLAELAARFPGVLAADGTLDRRALAERVFADPRERAALGTLLHPRIHRRFLELADQAKEDGARVVIYDAALLIENRIHEDMDGVVLVTVPRSIQLQRLRERDGLTEALAEARLAAQLPLESKIPHARWIVDNSGAPEATAAQVDRIWRELQESAHTP